VDVAVLLKRIFAGCFGMLEIAGLIIAVYLDRVLIGQLLKFQKSWNFSNGM
jgi:hypothetical protein